MRKTLILAVATGLIVSGCSIDQRAYETEPVQVSTSKGIVTCQLYRDDRVLWDEATDFPAGMTLAEADQICIREGIRVKEEGRTPSA